MSKLELSTIGLFSYIIRSEFGYTICRTSKVLVNAFISFLLFFQLSIYVHTSSTFLVLLLIFLFLASSWTESYSAGYLWPVGLACAVRPTAAVPFLPLAVRHLWHSSCWSRLLLHYMAITYAMYRVIYSGFGINFMFCFVVS